MLCTTCAGTEHLPFPGSELSLQRAGAARADKNRKSDSCPKCGDSLLELCTDCGGAGRKLVILSACGHCGQSLVHWQPCEGCEGSGKHAVRAHTCHAAGQPARVEAHHSTSP